MGVVNLDAAVAARPPTAGRLELSTMQLASLEASSPERGDYRSITTIVAAQNRLITFAKLPPMPRLTELDVRENCFRGLDARSGLVDLGRAAPQLRALRCASNNISFVDLPVALFANLTCLDLSGNLLVEFPDVSTCVALESLYLHGNRLETLDRMDERVPPAPSKTGTRCWSF
jgi:hypothetical protein